MGDRLAKPKLPQCQRRHHAGHKRRYSTCGKFSMHLLVAYFFTVPSNPFSPIFVSFRITSPDSLLGLHAQCPKRREKNTMRFTPGATRTIRSIFDTHHRVPVLGFRLAPTQNSLQVVGPARHRVAAVRPMGEQSGDQVTVAFSLALACSAESQVARPILPPVNLFWGAS